MISSGKPPSSSKWSWTVLATNSSRNWLSSLIRLQIVVYLPRTYIISCVRRGSGNVYGLGAISGTAWRCARGEVQVSRKQSYKTPTRMMGTSAAEEYLDGGGNREGPQRYSSFSEHRRSSRVYDLHAALAPRVALLPHKSFVVGELELHTSAIHEGRTHNNTGDPSIGTAFREIRRLTSFLGLRLTRIGLRGNRRNYG